MSLLWRLPSGLAFLINILGNISQILVKFGGFNLNYILRKMSKSKTFIWIYFISFESKHCFCTNKCRIKFKQILNSGNSSLWYAYFIVIASGFFYAPSFIILLLCPRIRSVTRYYKYWNKKIAIVSIHTNMSILFYSFTFTKLVKLNSITIL